MKLFDREEKAETRWRRKAWMVNPHKTEIVFVTPAHIRPKHVPPWIYRKEHP